MLFDALARSRCRAPSPDGIKAAARLGTLPHPAGAKLQTDHLAQAVAPGHAVHHAAAAPTPPDEAHLGKYESQLDRCLAALGLGQAALGSKGEGKTFEELRRAVVSAQGPKGQERLHIGGALARWLALGCKGPIPEVWHLLVEVLTAAPASADACAELERAAQRIAKRLAKRGFLAARAQGHEVFTDSAQRGRAVRLMVCHQGDLRLPEALACEQLTFELGAKIWRPLPHSGLTLTQAERYMEAGFWRVPKDPKPSVVDVVAGAAPGAPALQQGLASLAAVWRHLQLGYSPQDVFDVADTALVISMLRNLDVLTHKTPQHIQRTVVALSHETLAPTLCADGSEARKEQLGLAVVALQQMQWLTRAMPEAAALQLFVGAMDGFLRSQGAWADGHTARALQVARALSASNKETYLLRLLLQASPETAHLSTLPVAGVREPMLRVALPDCRAHLFVPDTVLDSLPEHNSPIDLADCIQRATSPEHLLALCLTCPAVEALAGLAELAQNTSAIAWAQALARAARTQPNNSRLMLAVALLHPETFAELPPAWQARSLPWRTLIGALEVATHKGQGEAQVTEQLLHTIRLRLRQGEPVLELAPHEGRLLIEPLLALDAHDEARIAARPDVLRDIPADKKLHLLAAGMPRDDGWADAFLTSLCDSATPFLAEAGSVQVLIDACSQPRLLPRLAKLLAANPHIHDKLWAVFVSAASAGADAAPLTIFVTQAPGDHPRLFTALNVLGDGNERDYHESRCQAAALAWGKWLTLAHNSKRHRRIEAAAAIMRLNLKSLVHSGEALCHDPELATLAVDVIEHGGTGEQHLVALGNIGMLANPALRARGFMQALHSLEPQELLNSGLDDWQGTFAMNLAAIAPHLPALGHIEADRLQKLALTMGQTRGYGANTIFSNTAAIAQVMVQQGYLEGACLILAKALVHSHAQHVMFGALTTCPILGPDQAPWVDMLEMAATMLAYGRHTQEHTNGVHYASRVRFFFRVGESAVMARCMPQVLETLPRDQVLTSLREATRLLTALAQISTLTENSRCVVLLRRAIAATNTHADMRAHHITLFKKIAAGELKEYGGQPSLPPCIVATALPSADLDAVAEQQDPAAEARHMLRALFGDDIDAATGLPHSHASTAAHAYAVELSASLLQGWPDEAHMLQVLRGLVTARLHDDHTVTHIDTLSRRLPDHLRDGPNHPLLLAAQHVVDARQSVDGAALTGDTLEAACLNVCFALRVLTAELDEPKRMGAIIRIVQSIEMLPATSRAYWAAATMGESFMGGLDSEQKAAIEAFHVRFELIGAGATNVDRELWNADRNLRAHLEALLARLQGPRDGQRHLALFMLMALGQNYHDYASQSGFKDFQRGLATLLGDKGFYIDVIDILTAYTMDPSQPIMSLPFIMWLNEAFLLATPMTSTYMACLLTMLDLHPKTGTSRLGADIIIGNIKGYTTDGIDPTSRWASTLFLQLRRLVSKENDRDVQSTLMQRYQNDIMTHLMAMMPEEWPPRADPIQGPYVYDSKVLLV